MKFILCTLLLLAGEARAQDPGSVPARRDFFSVGFLGGAMFPADRAYDGVAPEFGLMVGYSPQWRNFRLDLSAFATAGRSAERGFSALANWLPWSGSATPYLGAGVGLAWLGVNYALLNQLGWHVFEYPEEKPHAPFLAAALGMEIGRDRDHPLTLGVEAHFPFDYLALDVRFPSVLGAVRFAF